MHRHHGHRTIIAIIAVALAISIGIGLAAAPLSVEATSVPFADGPTLASVDVAWRDGLVLVFGDGAGIGVDAHIPDAAAADGNHAGTSRIGIDGAAVASGLVSDVRSGVVLTLDSASMRDVQMQLADRLGELGFDVRVDADQPTIVHARSDLAVYRLVFSYVDGRAVRLYVGS